MSFKVFKTTVISARILNVITKTHLFKYIDNFTTKNWKF